jgi:hypothetical protein
MANITLNDEMIRGAITGAVEQQHRVSSTVWSVIHSETSRALTAADGTTPAATKYAEMAKLWTPAVQAVYADPAAPKGTITDPALERRGLWVPSRGHQNMEAPRLRTAFRHKLVLLAGIRSSLVT